MMRNKFAIILLLAGLQLCAKAQTQYTLDIKKSKILWKVVTIGKHSGTIHFNKGTLNYSAKNEPLNGAFDLNMKSLHSTSETTASKTDEIDKELATPTFFDVAQYPSATIRVKKITAGQNPTSFRVFTDVTIKGMTNPVEFTATLKGNGDLVLASASFEIDRRQWHIDYKPKHTNVFDAMKDKMINNDIELTLALTFNKVKAAITKK